LESKPESEEQAASASARAAAAGLIVPGVRRICANL
jgi:hypothetical protein